MKRNLKRLCALLLALIMALALFACNKTPGGSDDGNGDGSGNGDTPSANQPKSKPTNVYKETAINLGDEVDYMWRAALHEGRLYFTKDRYDEDTGASYAEITSVSIDGSADMQTHLSIETSSGDYVEGTYSYTNISSISVAKDGAIWLAIQETYEDYRDELNYIYTSTCYIKGYNPDGSEIGTINLNEAFSDNDYLYVGYVLTGDNGKLYVTCNENLVVADMATGAVDFILEVSNASLYNMFQLADGSVVANLYSYEDGKQQLTRIDLAAKDWGAAIELNTTDYFDYVMQGDGDYLFYYMKYGAGVYGVKADGTSTEVLNFLNSDIDSSSINSIIKLGEEEFLLIGYDYNSTSRGTKVSRLTHVPDDEVKEAIILTYACMYLDYNVRRQILDFNKTNGEYRISVLDYSQYNTEDDWSAGYTRLSADIIGGNIPDMFSMSGLDMKNFVNKGILANIYDLMDASTVASREDYEQSVLKADEIDGGLYRFVTSYAIRSVAAKSSLVGTEPGWTMDDLNALLATMPEGTVTFQNMTRDTVLNFAVSIALDQFIDWETGQCSFGEEFAELLEFSKTFPEEIDWESVYSQPNAYEDMENAYKENRALLMQTWVYSYRAIRDYKWSFDEDITFIGFPTDSKKGSMFQANTEHGISARSINKQVCFDFLAGTVQKTPDFKDSGGYFYGEFSLSREYNEKVRAYELTPLNEREGYQSYDNGGEVGIMRAAASSIARPLPADEPAIDDGTDDGMDDYERTYHLTEAEVAAIDKLFETTTSFYTENTAVTNIIMEEAAEFFAGRKSATDTTGMIQSRVSIMVSESL